MTSSAVLEAMREQGVVAVLRSKSTEEAQHVAQACFNGGVSIIEVTFSVPQAAEAIRAIESVELTVGAGTVTTAAQAAEAIEAGAKFLVAPNFSDAVAAVAREASVPYIPGCMTVTEMTRALDAGCPAVKLFPASEFTPGFIKAVHAPLPNLQIMPTGGINLQNTADWIAAGAFCVGVGGNLTRVVDGNYAAITEAARGYRQAVDEGRR